MREKTEKNYPYQNLYLDDMEGEIWKDVVGYEGLYKVSNLGRVKSVPLIKRKKYKILSQLRHLNGYFFLNLSNNGIVKYHSVSRLVASIFCEKKIGCDEVNHIDEDKNSNLASNLEWCNRKYNCNYKNRNKSISTEVYKCNLNGDILSEYKSQREASDKHNIYQSEISRCCMGIRKTAGGYIWKYKQ